jgi:hypothetical protein
MVEHGGENGGAGNPVASMLSRLFIYNSTIPP